MLKLEKIKKTYVTGDFVQDALKDLSLEFRENEFVAILGPSGSGKTTLLNIIGGLDRYNSGNLIINGKETKNFKNEDWDAYRNNCIGFVFQNYNLIPHISILSNVEMGMTLSGVSVKERREKSLEVLERVGLKDHVHKKPNQLSGGQMQRVAIARALANDPDIILADEPTGALDSKTSIQILDLIKEIAKDKLVVMVTHNAELANKYASRVVELKDGMLIKDSNPVKESKENSKYEIVKTAMSFLTALSLSFNNIITKKGRTLLTSFASSIWIIGIALILSLSNGFDKQIDKFEAETISSLPIIISQNSLDLDIDTMRDMHDNYQTGENKFPSDKEIYPYESYYEEIVHKNIFTEEYIDYIKDIDKTLLTGVSNIRMINLNLFRKDDKVDFVNLDQTSLQSLPKQVDESKESYLSRNFDLLEGSLPENKEDIIVIVNPFNQLNNRVLEALGFDFEVDKIDFKDIIGKEIKLVTNNNYYKKVGNIYTINTNLDEVYNKKGNITLRVSGIVRMKEDVNFAILNEGIAYEEELIEHFIENAKESNIVKAQVKANYNILSGQKFQSEEEKMYVISALGGSSIPAMINLYPNNFDSKEEIIKYLDKYNDNVIDEEKVIYTDLSSTMSALSGNIMDAITIVLIAFSSIALVVSSIMIGVITYISVLERTKEIGILISLGARKKDIARVFNAETFIIGLTSGILGIVIATILIFPMNTIIENLSGLPNVAVLNPIHALILVIISLTLTVIGGYIPAIIASKKDPVEALRTE